MNIQQDVSRYNKSSSELFQNGSDYVFNLVSEAFSGAMTHEDLVGYHEFWYAIASAAALRSLTDDETRVDLSWAQVANTTYKYLSMLPGKNQMMWSWMLFKVQLINTLGGEIDSALANPTEVTDWFFDNLTIPFDEMQRLLKIDPLQIDTEKHMEMLYIKERAKIASYLKEGEHFQRPPELHKWIQLFGYDVSRRKRK